jgi:hypothetical protein
MAKYRCRAPREIAVQSQRQDLSFVETRGFSRKVATANVEERTF